MVRGRPETPVPQAPPRPPQAARGSWQGAGHGSPEETPRRPYPFLSSSGPGRSNRRGEFLWSSGSIGPHPGPLAAVVAAPPRGCGGGCSLPLPSSPFLSNERGQGRTSRGSGALAGEDWRPDSGRRRRRGG